MTRHIFKVGLITAIIIINIFLLILLISSVKNYITKIENGDIINNEEIQENQPQDLNLAQIGLKILRFIADSIIVKIILLILGIFLVIFGIIICAKM